MLERAAHPGRLVEVDGQAAVGLSDCDPPVSGVDIASHIAVKRKRWTNLGQGRRLGFHRRLGVVQLGGEERLDTGAIEPLAA